MDARYHAFTKTGRAFIGGADWRTYKVMDCLPDYLTDEARLEMAFGIIIDTFKELCAKAGDPSVRWHMDIGEITFDCIVDGNGRYIKNKYKLDDDAFFDVLRDRAIDMVACPLFGRPMPDGEDSPLQEKVERIMLYLPPDEYTYLED